MEQIINELKNQISTNQFLSGGVILGAITTILYSLKTVPIAIWSRIKRNFMYSVTIDQLDDLYVYIQRYVADKHKKQLRNVQATFYRVRDNGVDQPYEYRGDGKKEFRPHNRLSLRYFDDFFFLFYKWRFIRIGNSKEKLEHGNNALNLFFEKYVISGLFAKNQINKFIKDIIDYNISLEEKRECKVYSNGSSSWRISQDVMFRDIDCVFIPPDAKRSIVNDVESFINNNTFYNERNIPYRRGICYMALLDRENPRCRLLWQRNSTEICT